MECLHGKAAASTTTNNGTFWFCGEKPSCEFFCPDENCYMYTRAVAAFRASGSIHPVCPTHQKFAKLCVVKDTWGHFWPDSLESYWWDASQPIGPQGHKKSPRGQCEKWPQGPFLRPCGPIGWDASQPIGF